MMKNKYLYLLMILSIISLFLVYHFFDIYFTLVVLIGMLIIFVIYLMFIINKAKKELNYVGSILESFTFDNYKLGLNNKKNVLVEYKIADKLTQLATKLEHNRKKLTLHDEKLETLIDNLIVGVLVLNSEERVALVNHALEKMFVLKENILGKHYNEVLEEYRLIDMITAVYKQKKFKNEELILYSPQELIIDVHVKAIFNSDNKVEQVIILLHDITDIRRLEKVRSEFVTNASHELRTPITALKGFSETLLAGELEDKETTLKFLKIIHKESARLDRLVADILHLSKLEQKTLPLNVTTFSLDDLIQEDVALLNEKINMKNIELLIQGHVPKIRTDRSRLSQVILNLLGNAVNYTDPNGKIEINLLENNEQTILSIKDNGIGIPEDDLERIFERFYRVDKARSRVTGGTGLGLSIVRNLIATLNGEIAVTSELGKGSTFTIKLPINKDKENFGY